MTNRERRGEGEKRERREEKREEEPSAKKKKETTTWNDWETASRESFGGDEARKIKFMRLMGASKSKGEKKSKEEAKEDKSTPYNPEETSSSSLDLGKGEATTTTRKEIDEELEKQFKEGIERRFQKSKGLGFH